MLLSKEQILNAEDLKHIDVKVPEWGGAVRVRTMNGSERDQFEQAILKANQSGNTQDLENIRALLVALTVVDENGNRLFDKRDVKALGQKSAAALQRVFEAAQKLSAIGDNDIAELEGN